ncbi:MAG TPA: response regulator transcription factor [Thermoanaerobaculia bacterium]|nr:response regulator transcription factor [Thermoanaerobaculia bacterium]
MIHLLIADDHPVVRRGLRQILDEEPDMQVAAEAGDAEEILARLRGDGCDLLVLDLSLPGALGIGLLQELHATWPQLPILVLSIHPEEHYALRCLKAGARGYLHKQAAADELVGAIRAVNGGRRYLSATLAETLLHAADAGKRAPHEELSTREYQVLTGLAGGSSVTEIAGAMGLSVKTVSTYRARMLDKLGVGTNAEATRYALEHGLLDEA